MPGEVDIVLPTGEQASVPQADLAQALAAGAQQAPQLSEFDKLGTLGQAASAAFGAGRTASFGTSDGLLIEGANVFGGESARADMLHGLNVAKETNPYSNLGGEAAGLFVGAGAGVMKAGGAVESAIAGRVGEGLLGKAVSMGARGAVEGAALGAQHQITEDTLGDADYNGEKVFAAAGKDALLGGGIGAGIGVASHFGSEALQAFRAARGPVPSGLLDEVAGVEGAGTQLRQDVKAAESFVGDLQKTGATSEQAAVMADEMAAVAKARTAGGPLGEMVDAQAARLAKLRSGGNADMEEVLMKGYGDRASKLAKQDELLDAAARKLADKGTNVLRNMEDVVNDAQFTQKASNVAEKIDPAKFELARDTAMKSLQDADAVLGRLEATASKGGQEGAVNSLRKQLTDLSAANEKIDINLLRAGSERGAREATAGFYTKLDNLKQSFDRFAGHGTSAMGRSEASREFRTLADQFRSTLEDESIWGSMGAAQRETNATFSLAKGRRDDFMRRFAVDFDQVAGVPQLELDAGKIKGALRQLEGAEGDQAVKTTQAAIDGYRARAEAIEKHFTLTPAQSSKLASGKEALNAFEEQFQASRKEASVIARLRTQQLEEQGRGLGGVLGLAQDIMTKPLQQMERLGALKATTDKLEKAIAGGMKRFFDGEGASAARTFERPAAAAGSRGREAVTKEIGELREVAANPAALQTRVGTMLGDIPQFAPKIGSASAIVAMRALTYLASQAPQPRVDQQMLSTKPAMRFSDQELSVYENKRQAAFHPESVIAELQAGKLNRDGIKTVQVVYPKLFAQMQDTARTQLMEMDRKGLLDKMPYQQKAAIASLLQVAPDGTWKPDFMALMQSTKAPPPPPAAPAGPSGGSGRPIKLDTAVLNTEAQTIEGR